MQSFRRGIDRRAYVLARAQCGDTELVYQALSAVDQKFHEETMALPIAQWPIRFWTLLLSRKELTQGSSPWPALASISHGSRAALLLRLVGGLDFVHAAQVLGISEDTYRFALQRGLEQLQQNGHSMAELEQLRDDFFDEVKQLSHEQLTANIQEANRQSDALLHAEVKNQTESDRDFDAPEGMPERLMKLAKKPARRRWPWVLLAVIVAAAAAYGIYRYQKQQRELEALAIQARATEADRAAGDLLMHADYAAIAAGDDVKFAEEMNFYSWLAAGAVPEAGRAQDASAQNTQTLLPEAANNAEPINESIDQE
jgi:hypothetical protein